MKLINRNEYTLHLLTWDTRGRVSNGISNDFKVYGRNYSAFLSIIWPNFTSLCFLLGIYTRSRFNVSMTCKIASISEKNLVILTSTLTNSV